MKAYFGPDENDPAWSYIKLAWSTVANIAIAPLQDFLRLGSEARMNFPGTASGNWQWRFQKNQLNDKLADEIFSLTRLYGR